LIAEATGKVLDVTEAQVVRAAETAMSIGAWAIPFCYRMDCHRLINSQRHKPNVRLEEKTMVGGIGTMAIMAHRGDIPVKIEVIQAIAEAVGPTLHDDSGYNVAIDPHTAQVCEKLAPLHNQD
jgi:hypothetical protein